MKCSSVTENPMFNLYYLIKTLLLLYEMLLCDTDIPYLFII